MSRKLKNHISVWLEHKTLFIIAVLLNSKIQGIVLSIQQISFGLLFQDKWMVQLTYLIHFNKSTNFEKKERI